MYKRNDADEGGKAFVQAESETGKEYGQKQNYRNQICQDGRFVALPNGHPDIDPLVEVKGPVFWTWHGEDLFGLFAHAVGTLRMTCGAGTLCQYLDFQFVVGDFGDDTLVGDGFCVFYAAKLLFFHHSTKNHYFCKL